MWNNSIPIGWVKVMVNFTLVQATEAEKGSRCIALNKVLNGGWVVIAMPWQLYPRYRPCIHCIGGWVAPVPIWVGAENVARAGFSPQTIQPVARRYTDYAIPAYPIRWVEENKLFVNKSFKCLSVMNIGVFGARSLIFWWKITLWKIVVSNLVWQSKLHMLYLSINWSWLLLTGNADMCTPVLWTVGDALVLA